MNKLFTITLMLSALNANSQTYSATDSVILNTVNTTGFDNNSRGFEFVPNSNITITKLGHRLPDSSGVYTWVIYENASQSVIHQQISTLPNNPGVYQYEPISSPINLAQGTTYTFSLFRAGTGSAGYYYEASSQINSNLTYNTMRYCNSCTAGTFPTNTLPNIHYGTPDFHFVICNTPATTNSIAQSACGSYTSASGNNTWTTSGTYLDTIPSLGGCDSIYLTINLTINQNTAESLTISACDNYTSPSGQLWTNSGTYIDTIANNNGCDSIITIALTVNQVYTATQNVNALDTYTWLVNGQTYTQSGTYTEIDTTLAGCDSTHILILDMQHSGIEGINLSDISVYPNPVTDKLSIRVPENFIGQKFMIISNNGKIVTEGTLSALETIITVQHLTKGMYLVQIDGLDNKSFSVIKE